MPGVRSILPLDNPMRYVYIARPRCPVCESVEVRPYKTIKNGDGTKGRYTRCLSCGARFIVVVE